MLLASGRGAPPRDPGKVVEVKWDGCRAQLVVTADGLRLWSRYRHDHTCRFPEIAPIADALAGHEVILDGELVVFGDEGRPDFERLRARLQRSREASIAAAASQHPATFIAFDVLWLDGEDLCPLPWRERRAILEDLQLEGRTWSTPAAFSCEEHDLYAIAWEHGLEGVVTKAVDAPYRPGVRPGPSSPSCWVKWKARRAAVVEITGFRPRGDGGEDVDVFFVAHPRSDGGRRVYAGEVRYGLDAAERARLRRIVSERQIGRARGGYRRVECGVLLDVRHHGRPGGMLRDPVITAIRQP